MKDKYVAVFMQYVQAFHFIFILIWKQVIFNSNVKINVSIWAIWEEQL